MKFITLNKPYRYDAFIIWGNGLQYIDEILKIIRYEPTLDILRIEEKSINDMRTFIMAVYACDTVPLYHLEAKLKYLFEVDVIIELIVLLSHNKCH